MTNELTIHPLSGYELWYFRINFGIHALRVQWERHSPYGKWERRVFIQHSKKDSTFLEKDRSSPKWLSSFKTEAHLPNVAWKLEIRPGRDWIVPQHRFLNKIGVLNTMVKCCLDVLFSGEITVNGKIYTIDKMPGEVGNYHSRRAPAELWWLSAPEMEEEGCRMMCLVERSKPLSKRKGFVYLEMDGEKRLITAPLGRLKVQKSGPELNISFKALLDKRIEIRTGGHHFLHPSPGIRISLLSDLWVYVNDELVCQSLGKAGAERRLLKA